MTIVYRNHWKALNLKQQQPNLYQKIEKNYNKVIKNLKSRAK